MIDIFPYSSSPSFAPPAANSHCLNTGHPTSNRVQISSVWCSPSSNGNNSGGNCDTGPCNSRVCDDSRVNRERVSSADLPPLDCSLSGGSELPAPRGPGRPRSNASGDEDTVYLAVGRTPVPMSPGRPVLVPLSAPASALLACSRDIVWYARTPSCLRVSWLRSISNELSAALDRRCGRADAAEETAGVIVVVVNEVATSSAPADAMVGWASKTRPRVWTCCSGSVRVGGESGAVRAVMMEAKLLPRLRPREAMPMRRSGGGSGGVRRMGQRWTLRRNPCVGSMR